MDTREALKAMLAALDTEDDEVSGGEEDISEVSGNVSESNSIASI